MGFRQERGHANLGDGRADPNLPYHIDMSRLPGYGDLYAGFDVGRKHDMSVLAIVEKTETGYVSRGFLELRRAPFDEQEKALAGIIKLPNLHRICVDASGIGLQLTERLQQHFGYPVEPVTLSLPVKEDLSARMARVFQKGEIAIPDEPALLADLHSVEKQVTPAGNVRYAAPRTEGSHADRFIALALALHGADTMGNVTINVWGNEPESEPYEWLRIDNPAIWTPM